MRHLFRLAFALLLLAGAAVPARALIVTPLDELTLSVELTTSGETRAEALDRARHQAVVATVGRVFLTDQLIMADELLVKYLDNYSANFVNAVEVLEERFFEGRNTVRARVYVDYDRLFRDLAEKKFLYKPAYKPRFTSFLTERLDGRIVTDGRARESLGNALNNLGLRRYAGELQTPPHTTDVAGDAFLLNAAIVSSQRSGVEVIVSGEARTQLVDRKKLYFDEYWFYETEVSAKLVRVDTGEVLFQAAGKGTSSARNRDEAIQTSIDRASEQVSAALVRDFDAYWPVVVQQQAPFRILLTGVDAESLRIVVQNIERMSRDTKVFVRKSFGPSTVVEVLTQGTKQQLLDNLRSSTYPTLYIVNPDADRSFEVQVSG